MERARKVASTDELTRLLNRSGLDGVLRSCAVASHVDAGHIAVVYLDLNDFKILNDTLGHKAGDRALKVTAQRLQSCVRDADSVARLGGDKFICVILDKDPAVAADLVSSRLAETSGMPIDFGAQQRVLRSSIGVAVSMAGIDWDTLLEKADAALYFAKRQKAEDAVHFSSSWAADRDINEKRMPKAA